MIVGVVFLKLTAPNHQTISKAPTISTIIFKKMHKIKKRTTIHTTEFGDEFLSQVEEFNAEGQLILSVRYFEAGGKESESIFEYEDGKLIIETNYNEYGGENKTDYVYDIDGELRYRRMTYADGTTEQEKRLIEPNLEVIENYDSQDVLYKKQILRYDEKHLLQEVDFYENDVLVETNSYEYDAANRIIGRTVNDLSQNEVFKYRQRYDQEGNQILKHLSGQNEALLQKEESVFENGRLIEFREEDYLNGESRQVTKYEYNDSGNLLRETRLDWSGTIKSDKIFRLNEYGDPIEATTIETGYFDAVFGVGEFGRNLKTRFELEYF